MQMLKQTVYGESLLKVPVQEKQKNLLVLGFKANVLMDLFDVHPLIESLNQEHGTNLKVISHRVADIALNFGKSYKCLPAFAVDASIAYEKPGKKLGKEIVFFASDGSKVVLATGKYKGERDVALVALGVTSADFKRGGNSLVLDIPDSRLIVVPNFPGSDGWYMPHLETGIPYGENVHISSKARYLWRLNDSSYVGLSVRGYYDSYIPTNKHGVLLRCNMPSVRLGVVAEVPDADFAKIQSLISASAQTAAKTVVELPVSANELERLLIKFRSDLEILRLSPRGVA